MTRARLILVTVLALSLPALGCGSSGEKGINSGKDRPKPAEKAAG